MTQTSMDLGLTNFTPSDSDTQCTPRWLADLLPVVDLDPCSNSRSHIRARQAIALPNDGLAVPWQTIATTVWCNPPYSNPLPWAQAGADAFDDKGVEQMWLVKLDPTTRWWALLADRGEFFLLRDRIAFEKDGVSRGSSDICSAFIWLHSSSRSNSPNRFKDFVRNLGDRVWRGRS